MDSVWVGAFVAVAILVANLLVTRRTADKLLNRSPIAGSFLTSVEAQIGLADERAPNVAAEALRLIGCNTIAVVDDHHIIGWVGSMWRSRNPRKAQYQLMVEHRQAPGGTVHFVVSCRPGVSMFPQVYRTMCTELSGHLLNQIASLANPSPAE